MQNGTDYLVVLGTTAETPTLTEEEKKNIISLVAVSYTHLDVYKRQIYNARVHKGESIRVFPLSNWTELDIWQYIRLENIPIVPLYFAKERPCVEIDGNLIMADDDRLPEQYRDQIRMRMVRFRTLGCWPLTGAVESEADTIEKIVEEMMTTTKSERTTRVIDFDQDASMEQKKMCIRDRAYSPSSRMMISAILPPY